MYRNNEHCLFAVSPTADAPVFDLQTQRRGGFRFAEDNKGALRQLFEVFQPAENFAAIREGRHVVQQIDVTGRDRQVGPFSRASVFQAL